MLKTVDRDESSGAGQAIQQARETVEGIPHVFQAPGVSRIGLLIFPKNFLLRSRCFVRTRSIRARSIASVRSFDRDSVRPIPLSLSAAPGPGRRRSSASP